MQASLTGCALAVVLLDVHLEHQALAKQVLKMLTSEQRTPSGPLPQSALGDFKHR